MSDNQENKQVGSKLPRLPKIQGASTSLPKLPSLRAAKKEDEKAVIPALQSSATQLPDIAQLQEEVDEEEGGATQAISQPSAEELERALAEMKVGGPISVPSILDLKPIEKPASVAEDKSEPAVEPAPELSPSSEPAAPPVAAAASPVATAPEETMALMEPVAPPEKLSPSVPAFSLGLKGPSGSKSSAGMVSPVGLGSSPVTDLEDDGSETMALEAPKFDEASLASFKASSPSAVNPFNAPSPSVAPAAASEAEDNGPVFGGAASEESDLQYEDELGDDAGEKTMMLDAAPDEDLEDDIGGEKTQISMSSMDYDPLSGKLIVEAGKTNQREYILVREKTSIGRAPNNDITISDISMSRKHIEIDKFAEGFRLRDLDSGNGTVLNGYRIRVGQLRDGDIIEIGSIRFRFEQSGGDPEQLWKGEPKIEYHPSQKGGAKPGAANRSPSTAAAPAPSYSAQPSATPSYAAAPRTSQPQMESMLERQGGGIAAPPTWASASPMTAPYMAAYGPNALRNVNAPPMWANIVLAALIVICLGSISWFTFGILSQNSAKKEADKQNAIVERISNEFSESLKNYQNRDFEQALKSLQNAQELDKDGELIKDKAIFDYYQKLFHREDDLSNQISQIRDKTYSNGKNGLAEIEKDLDFLQNEIPGDSINKMWADRAYSRKLETYSRRLRADIRDLVSTDSIAEAKELLVKLSKIPDTESEVKNFRKLISDKEKAQN